MIPLSNKQATGPVCRNAWLGRALFHSRGKLPPAPKEKDLISAAPEGRRYERLAVRGRQKFGNEAIASSSDCFSE
jgi:hypothetical protein